MARVLLFALLTTGCDTQPAAIRPIDASFAALDATAVARPPGTPRPLPAIPEGVRPQGVIEDRCPTDSQAAIVIRSHGRRERRVPAAEAVVGDGSVIVGEGRHIGARALPLATLLEDGVEAIEVVPCAEEARRLAASELRSDPGRYLLVLNRRGELKLIDASGGGAPIARKIESFRLLP